jgi:hypothetical protein
MKAVVWHDVGKVSVGTAMNRNLTIKLGNCNRRRYAPGLLSRIAPGAAETGG